MAKVYSFPMGIYGAELAEQEFTLYALMHGVETSPDGGQPGGRTKSGGCYVTGFGYVEKGTAEFDSLIEKEMVKYGKLEYTPDEVRRLGEVLSSMERLKVSTPFAAFSHPYSWNRERGGFVPALDGCPFESFITDSSHLAVVHKMKGSIAIVPFEKERYRNLFYDIEGAKMADSKWQYDGGMEDALSEFSRYYTIDIARHPKDAREALEIKAKIKCPDSLYVVEKADVTLDEAISLIRGK